ncbi:MAG TPA: glycosyltransferase family 9 protein [Candidatus Saccharimonadales bacterium]|nr:glycosyltransferase family 9 protein [Candidatus Saccharimonadales bacterium]
MSWYDEWKTCKKILCIRPDNLGDVIMTTPVFRALRESFPKAEVTLLTSSIASAITPLIPDIDNTLIYDAPWIENEVLSETYENTFKIVEKMKKEQFDGAILLTNFSQNPFPIALLAYLAGIPKILGYAHEFPGHLINYWVADTEPFTFPLHGVMRQLKLISTIGAKTIHDELSLNLDNNIENQSRSVLEKIHRDPKKHLLILHPGASLQRRQYPIHLFINAAKRLIQELHSQILLTGNRDEKKVTDYMQKKIGNFSYSLGGQTTMRQFIALIKSADIIISNNTSAIHIAAAVGTPVVDMYARTNPEHTPWKVPHRTLYFDIPQHMRTRNVLLLKTLPLLPQPFPSPGHIFLAVKELLLREKTTKLPKEIITWETPPSDSFSIRKYIQI